MKKNPFILLFYAISVFSSCKKPVVNPPQENTYTMTVKEYKKNIPLGGVTISLYKCSNYDYIFGCQSKSLFATHSTDENGKYTFTQREINQASQGIILSKPQYWDKNGGEGDVLMEPVAIVNLTIKASKSYPDTSIFELKTVSDFGDVSRKTFTAPKDSLINYTLFGNEKNTISWAVFTKDFNCYIYCVKDTLASGILTLNPDRFEILYSSINY